MEAWFVIVVTLCITAIIRSILSSRRTVKKQPPGPSFLYSTFLLLTNSMLDFETILIKLKATHGPLFSLSIDFQRSVFVGSHSLAHEILIQKGALFSDRPNTIHMRNISTVSYGPTWRLLRRNLASEIMHPYRIKSYSWARKWVLCNMIDKLQEQGHEADGIKVVDHFQYAIFSLLVLMCFGEKFDEGRINEIAKTQRDMLLVSGRFRVLAMYPRLGKILFRNRWKEFEKLTSDKEQLLIPIIRSRIESANSDKEIVAYVDTLVNLQLPKDEGNNGKGGRLTYKDMVGMCSEFLNAGTDTTTNALQWIMANILKHPHFQSKLYDEIISAHFVLPHKATKDVEVKGYVFPRGATVNFMVAEMGMDPTVWDDPMEFKPERFMSNDGSNGVFDISGSKGIKMMPFGAGRRICPGSGLALLHLEYFVANLIWYFDWSVPDGYCVDLSEKVEFTVVMKNPHGLLVFKHLRLFINHHVGRSNESYSYNSQMSHCC